MNLYAFPPIAAVIDGAYAVLAWLASTLEPLAGAGSAALAVVVLTLAVRAALIPTAISQARAERARMRLAPKLAELQRRHAKNPEKLQRAMMDLYAREKVSPLAGCLPTLVQAPVISVVYALFILPTINGHANAMLAHTMFGVPLGSSFAGAVAGGTLTPALVAVTVALVAIALVVGELTRRMARAGAAVTPAPTAAAGSAPGLAALTRVAAVLPFLTAVIVPFVPLAAGLYLAVTITWTLGQRIVLRRTVIDPPAAGADGAGAGAPSPVA
ncbi:YidC/Oxa1 family membrane protein insertase [Agromyces intestinalis]|uniref:Membrane protein insertase YidC n=1 Tax=Agromyces intestinalis TaxID=2592652 RepID=A0A5C1YFL3_9MICO|nr:membrane protein insertase YidC [Agromyces intestinalis]QEO14270.1 YidC/Oxa1 family membrane protein insertase [Agromyces intestinalis]